MIHLLASFIEKNLYNKNFISDYLITQKKRKSKSQIFIVCIYLNKWMNNNNVSL